MTISSTQLVGGVFALLTAGLVLALWPRHPESPEEQIRREVVAITRAAEERKVSEVVDRVSDRFRSADGWDKQELKGVLAAQLLRGSWVRIFTTELKISVTNSTSAEMKGKFIFGRSDAAELKDLARESVLESYEVDATLKKESDGQWRFVSAKHHPFDPSGLF